MIAIIFSILTVASFSSSVSAQSTAITQQIVPTECIISEVQIGEDVELELIPRECRRLITPSIPTVQIMPPFFDSALPISTTEPPSASSSTSITGSSLQSILPQHTNGSVHDATQSSERGDVTRATPFHLIWYAAGVIIAIKIVIVLNISTRSAAQRK